jgi:hypothetical protein
MIEQHTPGPWEVVHAEHGIVVRTESPTKTKYGASRYAAIGGFDRNEPDKLAEAQANARLIAAAPDLLEALKELAVCDFGANWNDAAEWAAIKARAAIAKATGETK